jgi:hypothetical protein
LRNLSSGNLDTTLAGAREAVFSAFPQRLPDRIRNNHVVVYFGARLVADAIGVSVPDATVLQRSIGSVFNVVAGRGRTLADDFVEDVVNAHPTTYFRTAYDSVSKVFNFQLATAYNWWIMARRRQGKGGLERDAVTVQLREAPYIIPARTVDGVWMYGVDLGKAVELGLDIPQALVSREFRLQF